jgi:molybdopterin converting factor small subunit
MAIIIIPTPLRKFTERNSRIVVSAENISGVVKELTTSFPELARHLTDASGNIASFMNVFVDNDDIRNLKDEQTPVSETSVISIVPAIAGGIHYNS